MRIGVLVPVEKLLCLGVRRERGLRGREVREGAATMCAPRSRPNSRELLIFVSSFGYFRTFVLSICANHCNVYACSIELRKIFLVNSSRQALVQNQRE